MDAACAQCGQVKRILARRLCPRCYHGLWMVGKLDRYPAQSLRYQDWRLVAEERKQEIDRLRKRIKELEANQ